MTRLHTYSEGDIEWLLILCFDDAEYPDGSTASGTLMQIRNFFGDLTCYVDGEGIRCSVSEQERWARLIYDIIRQYPAEG